MNKFTELVKQWRIIGNYEGHAAFEWLNACACDLESLIAEHMTWVQITEDRETHPEEGQRVMHDINNSTLRYTYIADFYVVGLHRHWMGRKWRPLNDNDYPPQEVKLSLIHI